MANNLDPVIKPLPTAEEIRRDVEKILGHGCQREIAKSFCRVLISVADPDNEEAYHLAQTAAHHAFSFTLEFEEAFRRFVGDPVSSERSTTVATSEEIAEYAH